MRNTILVSAPFHLLAAVAFLFLALSCGKADDPKAPKEGRPEAAKTHEEGEAKGHEDEECEGHEHEEEEVCWLIDIGQHRYLGDIDLDCEDGTLTLTVLSHDDRKPFVHEAVDVVLNLVLKSGPRQLTMKADPQEGEKEGSTSRYVVQDDALKAEKELKGRLNITLGGKKYVCDLAQAH
jgi:hypothetical protein